MLTKVTRVFYQPPDVFNVVGDPCFDVFLSLVSS